MPTSSKIQSLLDFSTEYGKHYLATGGPTSRLEEDLSLLGKTEGLLIETFATPTGIFVSLQDPTSRDVVTKLVRIRENSIDLGKLCHLESILKQVKNRELTLELAQQLLNQPEKSSLRYTRLQHVLAAFICGVALSYPVFTLWIPALLSGLLTLITWWVSGPGLHDRIQSSIFRDFFGCMVALILSAFCQNLIPSAPFEAFSIGSMILLVPGLALTTAISELAEQNLVSGTSKLMQAILTLLALGLAYILLQEFLSGLHNVTPNYRVPLSIGLSILGLFVSVSSFAVLFQVPPRHLLSSVLVGILGWSVFRFFAGKASLSSSNILVVVTASYFASLSVGITSLLLGKLKKVPSQVFSVPGIIAMLPGMLALSSFRTLALGQENSGIELGFKVALSAGSIVFGLFSARIPFMIRYPVLKKMI
jgi:uncharacterized membrane protein YjjP (DUF1212 family)